VIEAFLKPLLILLSAYFLGSLPTALIVSRVIAHADIRDLGDGNMGARNVTHTLGWKAGVFVGVVDFSKGAIAVLLARYFGLSLAWQLAAGISAVIGHDFPIWAGFRGGQGMAAILGTLFVLMPTETFWGLIGFGTAYLLTRNFDLSAATGLGLLAFLAYLFDQPQVFLGYAVVLFLSIPAKKALDWPRRIQLGRKSIAEARSEEDLLAQSTESDGEATIEAKPPEEQPNGI
jgi:glycerol-3-phosphate acyltransferase PlsY